MKLISIDEVSISHKTKYNYSWPPHHLDSDILNTCFKDSKSIIIAITSMWPKLAWPLVSANNDNIFADFITKLLIWIKLDLESNLFDWVIILDNFRIHKTKGCQDIFEKSRAKLAFIRTLFRWIRLS